MIEPPLAIPRNHILVLMFRCAQQLKGISNDCTLQTGIYKFWNALCEHLQDIHQHHNWVKFRTQSRINIFSCFFIVDSFLCFQSPFCCVTQFIKLFKLFLLWYTCVIHLRPWLNSLFNSRLSRLQGSKIAQISDAFSNTLFGWDENLVLMFFLTKHSFAVLDKLNDVTFCLIHQLDIVPEARWTFDNIFMQIWDIAVVVWRGRRGDLLKLE